MIYLLTGNSNHWWTLFGRWLIKSIEGVPFSHVAIAFRLANQTFVIESIFPRVTVKPLDAWLYSYTPYDCYRLLIDENDFQPLLAYALSHAQKPYSIAQLFAIATKRLLHSYSDNSINNGSALICSELAVRILEQKFPIEKRLAYDTLGLRELMSIVDSLVESGKLERTIWSELL